MFSVSLQYQKLISSENLIPELIRMFCGLSVFYQCFFTCCGASVFTIQCGVVQSTNAKKKVIILLFMDQLHVEVPLQCEYDHIGDHTPMWTCHVFSKMKFTYLLKVLSRLFNGKVLNNVHFQKCAFVLFSSAEYLQLLFLNLPQDTWKK